MLPPEGWGVVVEGRHWGIAALHVLSINVHLHARDVGPAAAGDVVGDGVEDAAAEADDGGSRFADDDLAAVNWVEHDGRPGIADADELRGDGLGIGVGNGYR